MIAVATYELTIREHHLDTFGHVNNARYLDILEEARWDAIGRRGYGLEKVHSSRIGPVVLELSMQFKKELKNRDQIRIETMVEPYQGKVCNMKQTIFREGQAACIATFVVGLFDLNARRLINPTPEWLKALGLL